MQRQITVFLFLTFCFSNAQISDFNKINFIKADNNAVINKNAELENLPLLSYKLTHELSTEVEKFRAIYFWVTHNISSDYSMHSLVTRKRKKLIHDSVALANWNKSYLEKFHKKLIKNKKTMCTGFAYLVKKLANLSGIKCEIVNGYMRAVDSNIDTLEMPNHSWNAVKLDNKWYLCDPTLASGYIQNGYFVREYNDGYFLTEPALFALNHYPLDKKWLLTNNFTDDDFTSRPLLYSAGFKYKIKPISPLNIKVEVKRKEVIQFEFKTEKTIESKKISLVSFSNNQMNQYKIYDLENKNNIIRFKYSFRSRGIYDIHLKIEDDIVVTYSVKVSK